VEHSDKLRAVLPF